MRLIELSDANSFLSRANNFLLRSEAENNLLLSSAITLARGSFPRSPRLSFFVVEENGRVTCAGLNAAERRLLLSTSDPEPAQFLGQELAGRSAKVKGVLGPVPSAQAFCDAFTTAQGKNKEPRLLQRVMRLESLQPQAKMAPGLIRVAKEKDLKLLLKWSRQFVEECELEETREETEELVKRYLENRQLFVWEDNRVVAMAGYGGSTPSGVRVNMVYTDPAARARGYAGSLVYLLSRKLLSDGHKHCYLFVEQSNVAANRIYERLGYRAMGDFTEYRFI